MAAVGMGGGVAWAQPERSEREALILDEVKMLVELGVDVNFKGEDGKTALDGAKTLKFDSVIQYLTEHGAKAGTAGARGRGAAQ
jgi:ankyrin repeat protein